MTKIAKLGYPRSATTTTEILDTLRDKLKNRDAKDDERSYADFWIPEIRSTLTWLEEIAVEEKGR